MAVAEALDRPVRTQSGGYGGNGAGKTRLDQQISHLLGSLPHKIEVAKTTIEDDIAFTNLKKNTQGWSILVGSWKDVLSDWVSENRSAALPDSFGGPPTFYKYGFLFSYGVGFGAPLLLGHDSDM